MKELYLHRYIGHTSSRIKPASLTLLKPNLTRTPVNLKASYQQLVLSDERFSLG